MSTSIAILGANGRMGQRLAAIAGEERERFKVLARLARDDSLPAPVSPQVLIDFSTPQATRSWLPICCERGIRMLIGTTGLTDADRSAIDQASRRIAILQATNTSLGVAVLNKLVADAAHMFGDGYDVSIVESHHRFKKDAPSGTAISLAETIDKHDRGKQVEIRSLRLGDEIGTHTAYFALLGERLELTHRATSRDTFAHGALRAAEWLATRPPGRYTMNDVLGLSDAGGQ